MKAKQIGNKIGSYRYAAGRIRSLELKLMNNSQINRLFEARTITEIQRLMQECGYEAGEPEAALSMETEAVYELILEIMPDGGYAEALLLFHDTQNLKAILKHLSVNWIKGENPSGQHDEEASVNQAVKSPASVRHLDFRQVERLMLSPSLVEPEELFKAVRDQKPENIPEWMYDLAMEAAERYRQTYDISVIDLIIDRTAYERATCIAKELGNRWFIDYFILKRDLINLESLLRCKALGIGRAYFEQCLLPDGQIDKNTWLRYFDANYDAWAVELKKTALSDFLEIASQYGQPGSATRFGQLADQKIMEHLRKALHVLSGPEIPLAYLLARELEIKNIRIALTCLRNNIPSARARDMARESYLNWRV